MARSYNFSAGPAVLPLPVLEKAQKELIEYGETGMSVMEMSHRSKAYQDIIDRAEADLRELMKVPDNYHVLFLQGGASLQFTMIPQNLMVNSKKADYVSTGSWSKKAIKEAKIMGSVNVIASSEDETFTYIPELDPATFTKDADYFHITTNNTIYGTKYSTLPDTGNVPLVADMSSNILSQPYDISKFGLVYAGAQKNIGPSGVTVVIVRDDLVGNAPESVPTFLNYKTHTDNGSMFNTPPTYAIYVAGLVFEWMKNLGGVEAMHKINLEKSNMLYDFIDNSPLYKATVKPEHRSIMNVPFVTGNDELDAKFVKEAGQINIHNVKGHRSVGGMRASIYNAMPIEGVKYLIDFMKKFETENK